MRLLGESDEVRVVSVFNVETDWIAYEAAIVKYITGPNKGKHVRVAFELLEE